MFVDTKQYMAAIIEWLLRAAVLSRLISKPSIVWSGLLIHWSDFRPERKRATCISSRKSTFMTIADWFLSFQINRNYRLNRRHSSIIIPSKLTWNKVYVLVRGKKKSCNLISSSGTSLDMRKKLVWMAHEGLALNWFR